MLDFLDKIKVIEEKNYAQLMTAEVEHYLEKRYITFVLGPDPHQQPQINLESLHVKLNSSNNIFNCQPSG